MTYDEVRAAVHGYMHRNDAETIDNEPTALELARYKLGRDFFPESASVWVTLAIVNGSCPLPVDFGQADTVKEYGGVDLSYTTPRAWARMAGTRETGGHFTITGDNLLVDGAVGTVSMLYYLKPEPIGIGETSWLSADYPDVWIWLAVAEQHRFVQDFESAQISEQYAYGLAEQAVFRTRANRGGGSLRMVTRR